MYSDNETVDVASSDETEESDNEKEDNTAAVDSVDKCEGTGHHGWLLLDVLCWHDPSNRAKMWTVEGRIYI